MNYKKAKTILRKLNSMLESFENLGEPLSDIECEMLLRYADEFQKLVPQDHEEEEEEEVVVVAKPKPKKKKPKKKAKAAPKVEEIEEPEEIEHLTVAEPIEELVEDEEFDVPPVEVEEVAVEPVVEPTKSVKKAAPKSAPKKVSTKTKLVATEEEVAEDIDLWTKKEFKELSEKLSFSPIKDIFKAISINERIFTQNELFGGDHLAFRSALEQLEQKSSFEEAVAFLKGGIAKEQKWDSPAKVKKASQFMKLVQRRFL